MGDIERKIAVIDAAAAWAEAIRAHGPETARPFRENFLMALDDALTATPRGAVVLDDDTLASLDKRAAIHGTDRAAYLRWVLTGATNAASPRNQLSEEENT